MMLVPVDAGDMAPPSISDRPVPLPECSRTKTIRPIDEIAQTMRAMYEKRVVHEELLGAEVACIGAQPEGLGRGESV